MLKKATSLLAAALVALSLAGCAGDSTPDEADFTRAERMLAADANLTEEDVVQYRAAEGRGFLLQDAGQNAEGVDLFDTVAIAYFEYRSILAGNPDLQRVASQGGYANVDRTIIDQTFQLEPAEVTLEEQAIERHVRLFYASLVAAGTPLDYYDEIGVQFPDDASNKILRESVADTVGLTVNQNGGVYIPASLLSEIIED